MLLHGEYRKYRLFVVSLFFRSSAKWSRLFGHSPDPNIWIPRESYRVQPVQQFQIHSHSPETVLGSMKMKVCKARMIRLSPASSYGDSLEFFREGGKYSCTFSVFADNIGMFSGDKSVFVCAEADISFSAKEEFCFIWFTFLSSLQPGRF